MAVPADLFRVWTTQQVIAADGIEVLSEWSLVWYCTTGNAADPVLDVAVAFVGHMNAGITTNVLSQANVVYSYGGRRVAAGGPDVEAFTGNLPIAGPLQLLPFQCAVLVLGLSADVRHQTRKWIGGLKKSAVDGTTGHVITGDAVFTNWMKETMTPKVSGPVTATPVVWDPVAEVARGIETVKLMKAFRTQRRRSLAEEGQF